MALKNWYETLGAGDCLRDHVTWNSMIDYVKHSACTDFTIYSQCTVTGQAFRFTKSGAESVMYGGTTTGDDLKIQSNDVDTYPYIKLEGDGHITLDFKDELYFYDGATNAGRMKLVTMDTFEICGYGDTAGDLKLRGNQTDTYPYLWLANGQFINMYLGASGYFNIYNELTVMFQFGFTGETQSNLYGATTAGSDFTIYANSSNNDPSIKLNGAGNIEFNCAAGDLDFNCIEAVDFRLENRTDDPGAPCVGQIWFRTDL
jgi:hypothetical protein